MADAGRDVPLLEQRTSLTGYWWLWEAFHALTTCRMIGMSYGPIPWTAIQQYAEAERMTDEETYMLHAVIRSMDGRFLHYQDEKSKTQSSQAKRGRR